MLLAAPAMNGEVKGYVPRGESLPSSSRNQHWVEVEYQGKVGWVRAAYVNADGDCS